MGILLPDQTTTQDFRLDRVKQFDPRSKAYRAVKGIENKAFRSYTWHCDTYNDQGTEGACVGFSFSHELAAIPVNYPTDSALAYKIYKRAQVLDPWEGEDYEGTSILAGVKATAELTNDKGENLYQEYRWAFGIEDVLRVLGRKGPIVLGINWYSEMFDTDEKGFIHKGGYIAGGHAILAKGVKIVFKEKNVDKTNFEDVDLEKSYIVLHNSWGQSWGVNGTAKISAKDLDELLQEEGEAVIPVLRKK